MCNLYMPPSSIQLGLDFGIAQVGQLWGAYVAPLKPGPYVKKDGVTEVGQWGMIPPDCKTRRPATRNDMPLNTNNAKRERLATADTYKGPWRAGQRCLIPAVTFDEPYYPPSSTKSIAWRFGRADGRCWALAGVWAEWTR